jgi:hypothetical protein
MPRQYFNDILDLQDMSGIFGNISAYTPLTAVGETAVIVVDPVINGIMQELLKSGAGITFSLQSLLHIMVAQTYSDQMLFFQDSAPATVRNFVQRQIPGGGPNLVDVAGFCPGFVTVMALLVVHCLLFSVISWWFMRGELFLGLLLRLNHSFIADF